ncbi:MAG: hypothetical protein A2Y17_06680 [Clostridiales bacterium GWF2_38_85]|nr:MAG: hypothetical protein A2Y17_06680 [Clostridiales bacterium GWF2_38_85]HBL84900.1 hypothetical protein [Clostridiales bacterium]
MKKIITVVLLATLLFNFLGCEFSRNESSSPNSDTSTISEIVSEISENTQPALQWPTDNEFVSILPPFNGGKIVEINQKTNSVLITIVNVERAAFEMYVTALKGYSFTDVAFENEDLYSAVKPDSEKEEGVTVRYYNDTSTMTIDVSIK